MGAQALLASKTFQPPTAKFEHAALSKGEVIVKLHHLEQTKSQEAASMRTVKSETAPISAQSQVRGMDENGVLLIAAVIIGIISLSMWASRLMKKFEFKRIEREARDERRQMLKEDADRQLGEIEEKNGS